MKRRASILFLLLPAAMAAAAEADRYVEFDAAGLRQGRQVWLQTCEACHGYGVASAPIPMRPGDWAARVDKPRELLYEHAIEGFFGPEDTLMPARGGNDELSDEDVMRAVDYMVELAKHYLVQQRGNVK